MRALIVIAKAPLAGFAKTRLIGHGGWTAESVRRLADAFLRDTLHACDRVAEVQLRVCFAPAGAEETFRALAPSARLVPQVDGDLGARLCGAFDSAFDEGAERVVLIGMDTPHVDPAVITSAFELLDHAGCVLGPASDGGYYLIALRARHPSLFVGVDWSTERVLAQTLEHARAVALDVAMVAETFDIDVVPDLDRLERLLASSRDLCPYTSQVLAQHRSDMAATRPSPE